MLPLASDADVHGDIIRGLRRRLPQIDLTRVQDVLPAGTPDVEVLAWAAGLKWTPKTGPVRKREFLGKKMQG